MIKLLKNFKTVKFFENDEKRKSVENVKTTINIKMFNRSKLLKLAKVSKKI